MSQQKPASSSFQSFPASMQTLLHVTTRNVRIRTTVFRHADRRHSIRPNCPQSPLIRKLENDAFGLRFLNHRYFSSRTSTEKHDAPKDTVIIIAESDLSTSKVSKLETEDVAKIVDSTHVSRSTSESQDSESAQLQAVAPQMIPDGDQTKSSGDATITESTTEAPAPPKAATKVVKMPGVGMMVKPEGATKSTEPAPTEPITEPLNVMESVSEQQQAIVDSIKEIVNPTDTSHTVETQTWTETKGESVDIPSAVTEKSENIRKHVEESTMTMQSSLRSLHDRMYGSYGQSGTSLADELSAENDRIVTLAKEPPISKTLELIESKRSTEAMESKEQYEESEKLKVEKESDATNPKISPLSWTHTQWISYLKEKLVHNLKPSLTPSHDWWLHCGNAFAIISMTMTELIPLRAFLVGANICVFTFYATLRPRAMWKPAFWALFMMMGHFIMIIFLLSERRGVAMSDIENEIYCNAFRDYGFSPFQFKKVIAAAKYMRVHKGDTLCHQGTPMKKTMYVLGSMELIQNGQSVGGLVDGFVGDILPNQKTVKQYMTEKAQIEQLANDMMLVASELDVPVPVQSVQHMRQTNDGMKDTLSAPEVSVSHSKSLDSINNVVSVKSETLSDSKTTISTVLETETVTETQSISDITSDPNTWDHTVVALEESSIFVWDRKELHNILTSNTRIKAAASAAVGGDLKQKLKTDKKFNSLRTYSWMLEIVTYDGSIKAAEKATLDKFREMNDISQEEHEHIIHRIGWTMEEYDRGLRHTESYMEMMRNWYLLNLTTRYTTDAVGEAG